MSNGWVNMTAFERYEESKRKVQRLEERREYLIQRGAPREMIARYDTDISSAKDERQLWALEVQEINDREMYRLDLGMA